MFACITGVFWGVLFVPCLTTFKLKLIEILGALQNYNDDGNGKYVKKSVGLMRKTTTLYMHHTFL